MSCILTVKKIQQKNNVKKIVVTKTEYFSTLKA